MAEGKKKGTVTSLDHLFTSEEAEKAARRVEEDIADRQKELCRLRDFISENSTLIRHIKKLPEELSHDIMVPFGGAAFFPGRLVHTNEFLVLLGEGYYVDRSAKQTVEILQRRGKSLEAHLESLKRIIKDLEAEAKFFDLTASEVAEGLVEIREEYVEETLSEKPETGISNTSFMSSSIAHSVGVFDEEDKDAELMARLDELEKEEQEATSDDETAGSLDIVEEDDENTKFLKVDEDEYDEEDNNDAENVNANVENISVSSLKIQGSPEGSLKGFVEQSGVTQPVLVPPEANDYLLRPTSSIIQNSSEKMHPQGSQIGSRECKALVGTVIEHNVELFPSKPTSNSISGQKVDILYWQPTRPVSRFKMQKGNR